MQKKSLYNLFTEFKPFWSILAIIIILIIIGLIIIPRASFSYSEFLSDEPYYYFMMHVKWLFIGVFMFAFFIFFDYRRLYRYINLISILIILLNLIKFMMLASENNSFRVTFSLIQSERLMLFGFVLYSAGWLSSRWNTIKKLGVSDLLGYMTAMGIYWGIVLLLSDFSTSLKIIGVAGLFILISGWNLRSLIVIPLFGILMGVVMLTVSSVGSYRMSEYLNGLSNIDQASYHVQMSVETIIQGNLFGTEYQTFFMVPVPFTDSIYSVLVNQFGLVTGIGIILLYFLLALLGLLVSKQAKDPFGALLAAGISILIFFEAIIHIGSLIIVIPFMGESLPLISVGSSITVIHLIMLGVLLNISRTQTQAPQVNGINIDFLSARIKRFISKLLPGNS